MVTPAGDVYNYHFDAIGSTVALTDASQNMVNKYAYDPFGGVTNQVEAVTQPFKYVGQFGVMTEPNGFYYMQARYYDPNVGRFVSEDPTGFDGGDVNLYAYVGNNPYNRVDPWGLCSQDKGIDYSDVVISSVGTIKDYVSLAKVSTPADAAVVSASLIVNKLGVISAVSSGSTGKQWVDLGLSSAGLGLAFATGGPGAVATATYGLGKAAYNTPVIGTNQTVGGWWSTTINGWFH